MERRGGSRVRSRALLASVTTVLLGALAVRQAAPWLQTACSNLRSALPISPRQRQPPPTSPIQLQASPTSTNLHQPPPTITIQHQPAPPSTNPHHPAPTNPNQHHPPPTTITIHKAPDINPTHQNCPPPLFPQDPHIFTTPTTSSVTTTITQQPTASQHTATPKS